MNKLCCLILIGLLISCSNYGQLKFLAKLPKKLDESSGMVFLGDSTVWMINDSGNADKIYQLNLKGELLKDFKVDNAKNRDWEDMARDPENNVYIADTGNNSNKREDLVIYKLPDPATEKGKKIEAEKIKFQYPEQKKFPPPKEELKFDAEAIFYRDGYIYIITRNRAAPFDGEAFIYRVPAEKGEYKAELVSSFTPCKNRYTCSITSADISPDGQKIVLLSYGRLWLFTDFTEDDFTKGRMRTIDHGANTQLEAVCFTDNQTLLLSDERKAGTGRNLYSYRLK